MIDPLIDDNARKQKARKLRFFLYTLILLAFVLWMKHERSTIDTIKPAPAEANVQRQREIDAENHRLKAAFSLVKKASALTDQAEKINLYDEIITTYQDDKAVPMLRYVSWAMYKKALAVTGAGEKSRLLDEVIDKYCDVPDKQVGGYISASVRERLNQIEVGADKIAFCDSLLEKHGHRLTDSLAATLFNEKAKSTPDPAGQIAIFDMMLSRFLTSADDSAFDLTIIAALDKMALIGDKAEQIRLCDITIEAYIKTPYRTRYYLFDTAVRKKAELVGDPSLPLTLYNQVIANNVTEESVVQARSMGMPFLKDDSERLAACDEFISAHSASKSDFVQLMVARALEQKADLLTDTEAKVALLRSVIEKSANINDLRAKDLTNQTVAKLAMLSGDPASAASYYDNEAAKAKSEMDALLALRSKARLVKSQEEKVRIYDEIIAIGGRSDDILVSREVTEAILEKARLIDGRGEKIKLYDEAISRSRQSRDTRQRARVSDLMLDKVRILDNREAKINLYDEIIARGINSGNTDELKKVTQAKYEKVKLIDDLEEKTKLYDSVLLDMTRDHNDFSFNVLFPKILRERVNLTAEAHEKLRLYDHYLAAIGSALNPEAKVPLFLDKAELTSDPSDKSLLYDEVIEQCERDLKAVDSISADLAEFKRSIIMDNFGKAVLLIRPLFLFHINW